MHAHCDFCGSFRAMCISVRARTPDLCSHGWIHFGSGRSGDMGTRYIRLALSLTISELTRGRGGAKYPSTDDYCTNDMRITSVSYGVIITDSAPVSQTEPHASRTSQLRQFFGTNCAAAVCCTSTSIPPSTSVLCLHRFATRVGPYALRSDRRL
jgi:hypothetical protein